MGGKRLLYEENSNRNEKRAKNAISIFLLSSFLISLGIILGIASYFRKDTPISIVFLFPGVFILFLCLVLPFYFRDKKGLKIYEDGIVFPSLFKGKERFVPFSKIKVLYWNPDKKHKKFITFFITQYNPFRKKWINIALPFEKKYIYNIEKFKEIIKTKIKVVEDYDVTYDDIKNWQRSPPLL